jgi:hypothetical protein
MLVFTRIPLISCALIAVDSAGSIEALVSYIHRAETPVNVALSDPEFERHILSAATVLRFKVAKADVLSEQSQDRVSSSFPLKSSCNHFPHVLPAHLHDFLSCTARGFAQDRGDQPGPH